MENRRGRPTKVRTEEPNRRRWVPASKGSSDSLRKQFRFLQEEAGRTSEEDLEVGGLQLVQEVFILLFAIAPREPQRHAEIENSTHPLVKTDGVQPLERLFPAVVW
jgi:hypothetical protein